MSERLLITDTWRKQGIANPALYPMNANDAPDDRLSCLTHREVGNRQWLIQHERGRMDICRRRTQAAIPSTGGNGARPRIMSEAFSAIIIVEL
jgi:hypothetical protein